MLDPASIAGAIGPLVKPFADLKRIMKKSKGMHRAILLELRLNLQTVQLYVDGGIRAEHATCTLEVLALQKAIESEFDFRS